MQYANGSLFDVAYSRMYSPRMTIAARLDEAMKEAREYGPNGISQSELARKSGVPQATISRTLKGTTDPEADTIRKLAVALAVTFEWLHEGTQPKYRTEGSTRPLSVVATPPQQDVITADEIIELVMAYKAASKKDRLSVMNSAKTAAKRAARMRDEVRSDDR
jgi:transcriptional regulator with XRE-family HTH domain